MISLNTLVKVGCIAALTIVFAGCGKSTFRGGAGGRVGERSPASGPSFDGKGAKEEPAEPQVLDPINCSLEIIPAAIDVGGSVRAVLSRVGDVDQASIDGNALADSVSEMNIVVTQSRSIRGVVRSPDGRTASCDAQLRTTNPQAEPISCRLTATPNPLTRGQSTQISMTYLGPVTSAIIDGSSVPLNNLNISRTPNANTSYSAEVSDGSRTALCSVAVSVNAPTLLTQEFALTGNIRSDPTDLIFVMDDSFSMSEEIAKLRDAMRSLVDSLIAANIDYRAHFLLVSQATYGFQTQYNNTALKYELVAPDGSLYYTPRIFNKSAGATPIKDYLAGINVQQIHNEPGICQAMNYLNSQTSYVSNKRKHVVMLSDEDNDLSYETINPLSGQTTMTQDLFCQNHSSSQCVEYRKYNRYASWTEYCYDYPIYRYDLKIKTPGMCQKLIGSNNDVEKVVHLDSPVACATNLYQCKDRQSPQDYLCPSPKGGATKLFQYYEYPKDSQYCEVAQTYDCKIVVDGTETIVKTNRSQVSLTMIQSGQCAIDATSYIETLVHPNDTSGHGIRNCQACTLNSYMTTHVTESMKGDSRYFDCGATPVNTEYGLFSPFTVSYQPYVYPRGKVTAVTQQACPQYYREITKASPLTFANEICEGELSGLNLPPSVLTVQSGETRNDYVYPSATFNDQKTHEYLKQYYAGQYRVPVTDIEVTRESRTLAKNLCETVPLFVGEPTRNEPDFAERITSYTDIRDDSTNPVVPYSSNGVTWKTVDEANGRYSQCVRAEEKIVKRRPTPEEFVAFKNDKFPTEEVFFHTIGNLDGQQCAGQTGAASKATEYMRLSGMTSGLTGDICDPKFDAFMTELSKLVVDETSREYALRSDILAGTITKVYNKTTAKNLILNTDYKIVSGKIVFLNDAVKKDDQILIEATP